MQKWYYHLHWCFITNVLVVWLSLTVIIATGVSANPTTISFERKANMDIFENTKDQEQCSRMNVSFYKVGWCKCDNEEIFVGDKCIPKSQISGCRMGEAKEVLGATDLEYITVWDYNMERKGGFWNSAFSENIKMLIKDSHQSPTNMERKLAGMILKVTMNGNKRCMVIKMLGPSRYPIDPSIWLETDTPAITIATTTTTTTTPPPTTTTTTTTTATVEIKDQSIIFERHVNFDIFKNNENIECSSMNAELGEKNGWCKCDKWTIFAGHKCMPKNRISGCPMGEAKEVLINADGIDYIAVLDFNKVNQRSFWNAAFSNNIKMLIKQSNDNFNLEEELAGTIMKVTTKNGGCSMVKLLGQSQYPFVWNVRDTTRNGTNNMTKVRITSVVSKGKDKDDSNDILAITTIVAVGIVLVVALSIFLVCRKRIKHVHHHQSYPQENKQPPQELYETIEDRKDLVGSGKFVDSDKNKLPSTTKDATIRKRQSDRYIFNTNTTKFTPDSSSAGINNPSYEEPDFINNNEHGQTTDSVLYEEISPIPRRVTYKDDDTILLASPEDVYEVPIDGGTVLPQIYDDEKTNRNILGKNDDEEENLYEVSVDIIIPSRSGTLRNNITDSIIKINEMVEHISQGSNTDHTSQPPQVIPSRNDTLRGDQEYAWKELPDPDYTEMNEDNIDCQASECPIIPRRNGTLKDVCQGYAWKELPDPDYTEMDEDNIDCQASDCPIIPSRNGTLKEVCQGYAWKELPDPDYTDMNKDNTLYEVPVDSEIPSRPAKALNENQSKTENEHLNTCNENVYEVLN